MTKILTVLLVALVVESVGVVYLGKGLQQIGPVQQVNASNILRLVRQGATNPNLLFGVALEAAFFGALLYLLSLKDVSLIWPLTALGFVLTALAAKFLKGEDVSNLRWAGVILIVIGATLVGYSETQKKPDSNPGSLTKPADPGP